MRKGMADSQLVAQIDQVDVPIARRGAAARPRRLRPARFSP